MRGKFFSIFATAAICLVLSGAAIFVFRPFRFIFPQKNREQRQTRIVIPRETGTGGEDSVLTDLLSPEEGVRTRAAMGDGEVIVTVLTQDLDGDTVEEQVVAFRNLLEIDSPVYITYIDYDVKEKAYRRLWNAPTAATRPGTVSLYTKDLVGDRGTCVILTGMNGPGEHTMTIFRKPAETGEAKRPVDPYGQPFTKIAELCIDGSVSILEAERPQAYHLGIAQGRSFRIAAYGRNYESENILDQIETSYEFNPVNGLYEQTGMVRIPGSQIEQRRLRELLSGAPGVFEEFINDLWYYVSPDGTADSRQYIHFDPQGREIIFFGDETQQVFTWQQSAPTRYGLYISSQNISVTTLRRFLDIELESLNSVRVRVFEDVRLKIGVNNSWDGSYRRAGAVKKDGGEPSPVVPYIDRAYDSSIGKIRFSPDGMYELSAGEEIKRGRYVFFRVKDQELLELREEGPDGKAREIFRLEGNARGAMVLFRVRLGAMGIQDLRDEAISMTPAAD
ncbi:MAG: pallilysin-related adhesin [Treponema sp.]|jgi:hypothetical protein|nr:pallilysin-related adhesin [Treponema sp.]